MQKVQNHFRDKTLFLWLPNSCFYVVWEEEVKNVMMMIIVCWGNGQEDNCSTFASSAGSTTDLMTFWSWQRLYPDDGGSDWFTPHLTAWVWGVHVCLNVQIADTWHIYILFMQMCKFIGALDRTLKGTWVFCHFFFVWFSLYNDLVRTFGEYAVCSI